MKIKIDYTRHFLKQFDKCSRKIQDGFSTRLEIFIQDRKNDILNNHKLKGKLKGKRSINITGDWRAVFREEGKIVIFELLATHSELYK